MKTAKTGQRMTNKTALVLNHLQKKKTITSWEAIELFGATRLSAIIYNLRKKHCINSVNKIFPTSMVILPHSPSISTAEN